MSKVRVAGWLLVLLCLAATAPAQQTVAELGHESEPGVSRASISTHENTAAGKYFSLPLGIQDSALSRSAARALFIHSDVKRARRLALRARAAHPEDLEALFVLMEVAAMESNGPLELDVALSLCQYGGRQSNDPRIELALARVREAALNTPMFRTQLPRIQKLIANARQPWPDLSLALLAAAMDGTPGLDPYALSRSAGILTDWRIVGPLNRRALAGAEADAVSRNDSLSQAMVQGRAVENFQFADGTVLLPDYLARRGTFYGAAQFATLEPGMQTLRVQSLAPLAVYVDGALSLSLPGQHSPSSQEVGLDLPPGPHRLLVRFDSAAAPFRVQITPAENTQSSAGKGLPAEMAHLREQREAAENRLAHAKPETGCSLLRESVGRYREAQQNALALEAERRLDGCAPESLAFAEALSVQGKHLEAARSLRKILSAAPLNRAARLMLVRELQLAGDDAAAQPAAADWVRIAPNANSYRHMAAYVEDEAEAAASEEAPFYMPFRRDFGDPSHPPDDTSDGPITLLNDAVAIARPDGSVSLYVHRAIRATSLATAQELHELLPQGAQPLTLRVVASDGSASAWKPDGRLQSGDTLDIEYVVNYLGDGGISEHPEIFQHVFGSSAQSPLRERFVVLSAAAERDGGVVIVTGQPPQMTTRLSGRLLARIWEADNAHPAMRGEEFAVVRVVEQENGWTTPRNAERRRKIETAHPGPRYLDATLLSPEPVGSASGRR